MHCILPDELKKLRTAIKEKGGMRAFRKMETKDRIQFLSQYVDMPGHTENGVWLNKEFERRLLKPAQIAGAKEWLKKTSKKGLPDTSKKAILDRIASHKDVMVPRKGQPFMESLVKQVMGFELNADSAKKMFELSQSINELKKNLLKIAPDYYSYTSAQLKDAVEKNPEIIDARAKLGAKLLEFQAEYEKASLDAQIAELKEKGVGAKIINKLTTVAGNIKSVKASVDISYLRQLQSLAYVDLESFWNAWKKGGSVFLSGGDVTQKADTLMAELLTRPNALNGNYKKFGVDIGMKEEAFPESWAEKNINVLQAFTRSERSFSVAIQTGRADLFDKMYEKNVERLGVDGATKLLTSQKVGDFINTVTGRGKVPFLVSNSETQNRIVNNLLFAPKWLASRIETLYDIKYAFKGETYKNTWSPEAKRAQNAALNIAFMAVLIPAVKAFIWGVDDDDERTMEQFLRATYDPRSSDFGKIVLGDTRFDLTTGTAGILTLLARVGSGSTVNLSGIEKDTTWGDVVSTFLEGKASPGVKILHDLIYDPLFIGEYKTMQHKDTIWKLSDKNTEEKIEHVAMTVMDFFAPIFIQSVIGLGVDVVKGEADWCSAAGVVADFIGIAANTYDVSDKDIGKSSKAIKTEKQIAFATNKSPISSKLANNVKIFEDKTDEEIRKIREEFANELGQLEDKLINSSKFKKASAGEKDAMLRAMRKKLYAKYKTKYKPKKTLNKKSK